MHVFYCCWFSLLDLIDIKQTQILSIVYNGQCVAAVMSFSNLCASLLLSNAQPATSYITSCIVHTQLCMLYKLWHVYAIMYHLYGFVYINNAIHLKSSIQLILKSTGMLTHIAVKFATNSIKIAETILQAICNEIWLFMRVDRQCCTILIRRVTNTEP